MPKLWRRRVIGGGALCVAAFLTAAPAGAAPGTRSIVSVVPGSFTSRLGQPALTGSLTVQVAETTVAGDPAWSVTAQVSSFSDGATPPHTLPASVLANSANTTVLTGGGGTITEGSPGPLNVPVTLFSDAGQVVTNLYNGTYTNTSTLTLTPPSGTYAPSTGATYSAVITVTLIT